jgi:hypothetical protein
VKTAREITSVQLSPLGSTAKLSVEGEGFGLDWLTKRTLNWQTTYPCHLSIVVSLKVPSIAHYIRPGLTLIPIAAACFETARAELVCVASGPPKPGQQPVAMNPTRKRSKQYFASFCHLEILRCVLQQFKPVDQIYTHTSIASLHISVSSTTTAGTRKFRTSPIGQSQW